MVIPAGNTILLDESTPVLKVLLLQGKSKVTLQVPGKVGGGVVGERDYRSSVLSINDMFPLYWYCWLVEVLSSFLQRFQGDTDVTLSWLRIYGSLNHWVQTALRKNKQVTGGVRAVLEVRGGDGVVGLFWRLIFVSISSP